MSKYKYLSKVKEVYEDGGNIIAYLRSVDNKLKNSIDDIIISYDLQSGAYTEKYFANPEFRDLYSLSLATRINKLGHFNSILEVGVGEATTLGLMLNHLSKTPMIVLGLDISWSRLKWANQFLKKNGITTAKLFTSNLFNIPLADNSVEIVYTSHSIEPNGGKEKEALKELYRITSRYLVLLEPAYEFANELGKKRMIDNGYITNLYSTAVSLGYNIIVHEPFDNIENPLNPTGIIVLEKNEEKLNSEDYICPVTGDKLIAHSSSFYYAQNSKLVYPILDGIPCLIGDNAILASHLHTDIESVISD